MIDDPVRPAVHNVRRVVFERDDACRLIQLVPGTVGFRRTLSCAQSAGPFRLRMVVIPSAKHHLYAQLGAVGDWIARGCYACSYALSNSRSTKEGDEPLHTFVTYHAVPVCI